MSKFLITAQHAGLGVNHFIVEAPDRKQAFANFKSIVYSHRQWIITSNEFIPAGATVNLEFFTVRDIVTKQEAV